MTLLAQRTFDGYNLVKNCLTLWRRLPLRGSRAIQRVASQKHFEVYLSITTMAANGSNIVAMCPWDFRYFPNSNVRNFTLRNVRYRKETHQRDGSSETLQVQETEIEMDIADLPVSQELLVIYPALNTQAWWILPLPLYYLILAVENDYDKL